MQLDRRITKMMAPNSDTPGKTRFALPVGNRGAVPWASRGCRTKVENERRLDAPLDSATGGPNPQDCAAGVPEGVDQVEMRIQ